jgi:ABC-type xylose transport system permease subunit
VALAYSARRATRDLNAVFENGMNLLGVESSTKFMVQGGVLLLAATVDALSRRGRQAAGRA